MTTSDESSADGGGGSDTTTAKAPPPIDLEKAKKLSYELNITRGKGNERKIETDNRQSTSRLKQIRSYLSTWFHRTL